METNQQTDGHDNGAFQAQANVPKTGLSSLNYQTVHFLSVGM
jgi:hypothetical protein